MSQRMEESRASNLWCPRTRNIFQVSTKMIIIAGQLITIFTPIGMAVCIIRLIVYKTMIHHHYLIY